MRDTRQPTALGVFLVLTSLGAGAQTSPAAAGAQAAATNTPARPSVSIFGAANIQFESVSATGGVTPAADKPARNRVSNVSSDLGFRGTLPVAPGTTALFQYVTGINLDNPSGASGIIGGAKDTFLGLQFADIGTVKLGRLSGAARWISGTADFSPAGAGPQDNQAPLTLVGGQTGVAPQFNSRLDNAIGFESARWNGLSVRVYYSANEGRSNAVASSGVQLSDSSFSVGAQYIVGPLDLRAAFEQRNDRGTLNNTAGNDTADKSYRLGVRYRVMPNTQVALGVDHSSFSDRTATGTAKSGLTRRGWIMGARHQFGQHVVYGGYGVAADVKCSLANGAVCNGADTGARQAVLAYNYVANSQLLYEVFLSQVSNEARARYDFDAGGISPAVGTRPTAVGIGARYTF
jgi:predicted porin